MQKLLLLFFLIIQANGYSQNHNQPPSDYDHHCVYKKKYSDSSRLKFYPFSKAANTKLVSFRYQSYDEVVYKNNVKNDSLLEIKMLSKAGLDSLTDILYNNFHKKRGNIGEIAQCWSPRNAILFIDDSGNVFETIVICFHCEEYKLSSNKVNAGDPCYEKIDKLMAFFIKQGIKFGTNLGIYEYPGETIGNRRATIPPIENH